MSAIPTPPTPSSPIIVAAPTPNPLKRPLEEEQTETPSPGPSATATPVPKTSKHKTSLHKKEKKKDNSHVGTPVRTSQDERNATPARTDRDTPAATKSLNGPGKPLGLQRWRQPPPQPGDYAPAKRPLFTPTTTIEGIEFCATSEHPKNRRGFRYTPCRPSRHLPHLTYTTTDVPPFKARLNWEDTSFHVLMNEEGSAMTTEKGFRMSRANTGVREGRWYFECKILKGVKRDGTLGNGNIRVGWARREAALDAPVGWDAYSYSIRDIEGQKVHMSRPKDFMKENVCEGDVLGLEIYLPSLVIQNGDESKPYTPNIIRDRIPIRYKNRLYFESFELAPTKEMEELSHPTSKVANSTYQPKTIPGSYIKVYKNGKEMGTPFTDLFAFLPPNSRPNLAAGARDVDDGAAGYYPAVSAFGGGAASLNFGPNFEFPPKETGIRPVCERYDEQIIEDMVYDLIDEIDLWAGTREEIEVRREVERTGEEEGIKEMGEDSDQE